MLYDKKYVHITRGCSLGGAISGQAGLWTEPCGAGNMLTSTSLTFFTAIFLAFSGALAEELMILCRNVTTELYIYIYIYIYVYIDLGFFIKCPSWEHWFP